MSFVDNIIVILGSCFLLNDYLLFREGARLKLDVQDLGGGRISDVDGQGDGGS